MATEEIEVRIRATADGFNQTINRVEEALGKLGKTGNRTADGAHKWGQRFNKAGKALAPVSLAAAGVTAGAVKMGSTWSSTMGQVQAVTGNTAKEMQVLKAEAFKATQGTKFSAIEAGEAFNYMGMAGWDSGQMIQGLSPILNLATASGESLGTTSDIVTDSLTAFGLSAKDTGSFADVLASTSSNANTNVAMMGETFKYAAPVAGALGYSVQDVALATGLMANAGIKGSQAGTTLRSAMTNLSSPTKRAKNAMDELGISVTDSQGKMLPFKSVLGQLRTSFAGLTEEQKAQKAQAIFGKEAMSGMLAIINAGQSDFDGLSDSINNSTGATEKMAKTMQESQPIAVAMKAIENAFVKAGEAIAPTVTKIANKVAALAEAFTNLSPSTQTAIMAFVGFVAVLAPILSGIGAVLTAFSGLSVVAGVLGTTVGALVATFGWVIAIIAAVAAAGYLVISNWDLIKSKAIQLGGTIKQAWADLVEASNAIWGALAESLMNIFMGIAETTISIFTSIGGFLSTVWNTVSETWNTVWEAIGTFLIGTMVGMVEGIISIFTGVASFLGTVWNTVSTTWNTIWSGVQTTLTTVWNGIKTTATTVFNAIKTTITTIWNNVKTTTTTIWNGIKTVLTTIWNNVKTGATTAFNAIKTVITVVWNTIKSTTSSVWNGIKSTLTTIFNGIKSTATTAFNAIKTVITTAWNTIKTTTSTVWNGIKTVVTTSLNNIKSTFTTIFNNLKTVATTGMNGVKSAISTGLSTAISTVTGFVGRFVSAGGDLIRGVARGVTSAAGAVVGAVKGAISSALRSAKSALGIHSPSRVMRDEVGQWIPKGIAVGINGNTSELKKSFDMLPEMADGLKMPMLNASIDTPNKLEGMDLMQEINTKAESTYTFLLKMGDKTFKAFAQDIEGVNDRELDLKEFSLA